MVKEVQKPNSTHERMKTWRIYKNLLVVCTATAIQFSVFGSSVTLISSVRIKDALGNNSQVILYAAFIFGNFAIATICVRIFGMKNCIGGGMMMYSLSMVGNFHPTLPIFAITSVINGLGAAVYWISISCYIMELAIEHGRTNNIEASKFAFMGIFVTFFGSSGIWGNLVTGQLLTPSTRSNEIKGNETNTPDIANICGIYFCDWYATGENDIMQTPNNSQIIKLSLIFIASAVAASLGVFIFADSIKSPDDFQKSSVKKLVLSTIVSFKDPYHILLAPISFVSGLAVCFHGTDFTKAFISCTLGVSEIGNIMIAGGVVTTLTSVPCGYAERKIDRMVFIIGGCLIAGACYLAMGLWTPIADSKYFLYLVAAFWALSDNVFQGQLKATYSVIFADNQEAAFATFSTWQNIGILAAYAYDSYMCIFPKLLIMSSFLLLGIITYSIAEYRFRRKIEMNVKVGSSMCELKAM